MFEISNQLFDIFTTPILTKPHHQFHIRTTAQQQRSQQLNMNVIVDLGLGYELFQRISSAGGGLNLNPNMEININQGEIIKYKNKFIKDDKIKQGLENLILCFENRKTRLIIKEMMEQTGSEEEIDALMFYNKGSIQFVGEVKNAKNAMI
ncbi:MAG: hypothetical protein EZS28_029836 [Streblomastix strix]|uniref:Uncharacterized protein n=1 Tax=Streblomastix strix TaxID=222440 RepID=A0A5J4UVY2_9EUKA|nr:MAG: hypothetical protein EZS28_029836 [Streblomastix strix]